MNSGFTLRLPRSSRSSARPRTSIESRRRGCTSGILMPRRRSTRGTDPLPTGLARHPNALDDSYRGMAGSASIRRLSTTGSRPIGFRSSPLPPSSRNTIRKLKSHPESGIHGLRHTFLTKAAEHIRKVRTLQLIAGHANIVTTVKYIHPAQEDIATALESCDERASRKDENSEFCPACGQAIPNG